MGQRSDLGLFVPPKLQAVGAHEAGGGRRGSCVPKDGASSPRADELRHSLPRWTWAATVRRRRQSSESREYFTRFVDARACVADAGSAAAA